MKEIKYKDWQKNPKPREMWVWDDNFDKRKKEKVVYVIKDDFATFPVLTVSREDTSYQIHNHCAEIEEQKTRPKTYKELAWWLQNGIKAGKHREWKLEL